MAHVPIVGSASNYFESIVKALDEGTGKKDRIHAYLAGHEHLYYRIDAGTKNITNGSDQFNIPRYLKNKSFQPKNYHMISLNQAEAMTLEVSPEKLTFKSHRWSNPEGGLVDAFEIYPDGSVKDLKPSQKQVLEGPAPKK